MTNIVTLLVALFGGGAMGVIIKALTEKRKISADATSTNIKSLLEIDQRMNERMANLEERVANLEQENYKLKSEKLSLEKETHKLQVAISKLEEENKELREENIALKEELSTFINKEEEVK